MTTFNDMLAWTNDAIEDSTGDDRAGDVLSKFLEFMYDQPITFSNLLLGAFLAPTPEMNMGVIIDAAVAYAEAKDAEMKHDEEHYRKVMELTEELRNSGSPFGGKI